MKRITPSPCCKGSWPEAIRALLESNSRAKRAHCESLCSRVTAYLLYNGSATYIQWRA